MPIDLPISAIIYLFVALFPIFFLPFTADYYDFNKLVFFIVITLILSLFVVFRTLSKKKLIIIKSTFDLPLLFISGIFIISSVFQSPNLVVSLITPLGVTTFITGLLFYLLLTQLDIKTYSENIMRVLVISSVLLSVYIVLLFANVFPWNQYTPTGTLQVTATILGIISVYLISWLISFITIHIDIKDDDRSIAALAENSQFILFSLALLIDIVATILIIIKLFSDPVFPVLPFSYGWVIFVETLKNIRTLFLGVGPVNFITAFTLAKPAEINTTPYWNVIFTSSSSFLLTIATETGIISLISFIYMYISSLKFLKKYQDSKPDTKDNADFPYYLTLAAALTLQLILPSSMSIFITTIILMAICAKKRTLFILDLTKLKNYSYYFIVPPVIIVGIIFYFAGRVYLGEVYFKKSLDAMVNNQADATYKWQQKAITVNPYIDRYQVAFSKTNLSIANALASKKDPTDEDKQNIPVLIKQSIDSARTGVGLFRSNVVNWDNLATVYGSLINFAQGADNFAVQSHQQKLILDPNNPSAYLGYGGLLYSLKRMDEAETVFIRAINLKPDLANAHYNLGAVFREKKQYKDAYDQFKLTASLISRSSNDAKQLQKEIEDLAKLLPPEDTTASAELKSANSTTAQPSEEKLQEATPSTIMNLPTAIPTVASKP